MIFGLVISRARLATKADLQELFEKIIMPTQKEIADGLEAVRQELSDVSTGSDEPVDCAVWGTAVF